MVSKRERAEIARRFQSLRRQVRTPCAVCGKVTTGTAKRRYCSAACRQEAWRRRHRTG